ncbi:RIB43A-like with coiled-coils protein 1 [Apis mellifera caucasica]|uniref:RIB43A-like with coiled-coils protein 1 n=1 Tax=Apis mellifera TaxID=7460 RepID=A0A7M7FXY1_APIME|nr:RIB43A-like with coiled-coils protein 1 [Apis mellifera]KAG6803256.1 RIB43A-like with coiled-coils protein 1 [Apis mellifera caucasica]|eukprot:XP_001120381.1 RIB43A-like with coiled-coils protein 1 [Apis mellifera]
MLKFQTATKEELKLAAAVQRRRQIEAERKERIFNARFRKIGIDKEFLDKQVEEKKQQRELEEARESELDEILLQSCKIGLLLEKQQEEERRKIHKEIEHYRQQYQQRQECDLSKKGDRDLSFGELLKSEEEDFKEKSRAKKEEMRWWIEKQMQEHISAESERKEFEKAQEAAILSRDKHAMKIAQMEQDCRRKLNEATARFNQAMAEEQEYRRRCEALREEEDKKADIYNHVTGDFLTEAKEQAESTHGPHKPLASRYKGMTADELKVFREAQARQLKEMKEMKIEEKRRDEEWDRLMTTQAEIADSYQREIDRKKAEIKKKIAKENLELAEQQKSHQEYLNCVLYKNKATAAFYEQFNKDAR